MTYEEFRGDIFKNIKDLPNSWRKLQLDCFYRDDLIDKFIETSYKLL